MKKINEQAPEFESSKILLAKIAKRQTVKADDIALARKDYNDLARQYNEISGGSLMQYIVKVLNIETQFPVFEHIEQEKYSDKYEVFEMEEPEINKITTLNMVTKQEEEEERKTPNANPTPDIQIEHTKGTFKPTKM